MRVRTIKGCLAEIKERDQKCAITEWAIRRAIEKGELPYKKTGEKYLVTVEAVERHFGVRDGIEEV